MTKTPQTPGRIETLTRRAALGALAAPAALAATSGAARAQAPAPKLTLLLVNDIYKMAEDKGRGGYARLASIVKAERARGVPLLFCHAGDCYSPSLMSGFDQGAHIVEMQNTLGLDVFVPGNHEFDFGQEVYARRVAEQTYPTFAANLRDAEGKMLPGHRDSQIFELGGIKVGVVGLVLEITPQVSMPGDLQFLPAIETLRTQARALKSAGADLIVAVTHTDRRADLAIMRSRLADIVLSGHDHDLAIAYDGRTVMVESNEEGNYVTAIDLSVSITGEGPSRTVAWVPTFRVNDSRSVTPDAVMLTIVNRYEEQLSRELDVDVATLATDLDSRSASVRSGETAIGNLIADAIKSETGADIAITNGGGIRGNRQYPAGHRLTRRDVLTEMPFGNRAVVTQVTGRDVLAALENGVSQVEQRAGRFPHVSGLVVTVETRRPVGSRVVEVTVNGRPLQDDKVYKVATNDFMLKGGDGYVSLAGKPDGDLDLQGRLMASDVMSHARKLGRIEARIEGRVLLR
jgi:2',3'-cyclic-nucleotide 2'-phosphodiesterase (5'-nucleotidase family)